jgi:hypothetical protein
MWKSHLTTRYVMCRINVEAKVGFPGRCLWSAFESPGWMLFMFMLFVPEESPILSRDQPVRIAFPFILPGSLP